MRVCREEAAAGGKELSQVPGLVSGDGEGKSLRDIAVIALLHAKNTVKERSVCAWMWQNHEGCCCSP